MSREWIIDDDFLDEETKLSADGQGYLTELVRCKDCKYWLKTTLSTVDGEPIYDCPLLNEWGDEDGYCSYGERADT